MERALLLNAHVDFLIFFNSLFLSQCPSDHHSGGLFSQPSSEGGGWGAGVQSVNARNSQLMRGISYLSRAPEKGKEILGPQSDFCGHRVVKCQVSSRPVATSVHATGVLSADVLFHRRKEGMAFS